MGHDAAVICYWMPIVVGFAFEIVYHTLVSVFHIVLSTVVRPRIYEGEFLTTRVCGAPVGEGELMHFGVVIFRVRISIAYEM